MARPKKYHIKLTDNDVKTIQCTIRKKNTSRTIRARCQILLDLDQCHGKTRAHEQSARMNGVCIATVTNTVAAYVQSGLEGVLSLKRSENSHNTRRVLDGKAEALIIALVCGPAPEGHCRWTFRLLEGKSRLQLETPVSRETIRRALKKRTSTSPQGLLVYPGNSHFQKSDRLGAKHIPCHVPLLHLK